MTFLFIGGLSREWLPPAMPILRKPRVGLLIKHVDSLTHMVSSFCSVRDVEANKIAMFMAHQVPMINCICEVFQKRFQEVRVQMNLDMNVCVWERFILLRFTQNIGNLYTAVACTESRGHQAPR